MPMTIDLPIEEYGVIINRNGELAAENKRLREALRNHCVAQYLSTKVFECRECGDVWAHDDTENHRPGCLAAPETPPASGEGTGE
jgi:rubrerythrin